MTAGFSTAFYLKTCIKCREFKFFESLKMSSYYLVGFLGTCFKKGLISIYAGHEISGGPNPQVTQSFHKEAANLWFV